MQHSTALKRLHQLFRRQNEGVDVDSLSGPTLIQQEPDLAQETARYSSWASAWAANGHPIE